MKPIRYNKFLAAVEKAFQWFEHHPSPTAHPPSPTTHPPSPNTHHPSPTTLFIRVDGEWRNISISQITYVSGMKDYVLFYLDGERKPLISHLTMKSVEGMLPSDKFLRVHRSYIIAVDKIRKVDRNDCIYIGDEIIHIPDGYLPAFKAFLEKRSIT